MLISVNSLTSSKILLMFRLYALQPTCYSPLWKAKVNSRKRHLHLWIRECCACHQTMVFSSPCYQDPIWSGSLQQSIHASYLATIRSCRLKSPVLFWDYKYHINVMLPWSTTFVRDMCKPIQSLPSGCTCFCKKYVCTYTKIDLPWGFSCWKIDTVDYPDHPTFHTSAQRWEVK